jgi:hypothetical protein
MEASPVLEAGCWMLEAEYWKLEAVVIHHCNPFRQMRQHRFGLAAFRV